VSTVAPRLGRAAVLAAVLVCAACGLVYELALVTLGSYLIGDTAGQASIVLGVMVFAMGVGALAAKPLQHKAAAAFAAVELMLALLGGLSVLLLYAAFAWLDLYLPALVVTAFTLGGLIGAEIPLLMVLLQRMREQAAASAVADLFAADYVGALLGGLAFPFLLIPVFGQLRGALVVGVVNAPGRAGAGVHRVPGQPVAPLAGGAGRRFARRPARPGVRLRGLERLRADRPAGAVQGPGGARRAQPLPGDRADPGGAGAGRHRRHPTVPQRRPAVQLQRRVPLPRGAGAPGAERPAGPGCWSSAAATAWPCARCCATRTSGRRPWSSSTRR
jgi:hypothetical protein